MTESVDRAIAPHSLDGWLDRLERIHPSAIAMGLERVAAVRDGLGLKLQCPVIAVAGTNGKGSVCAMLESIYSCAGYKVGLYTSPHLLRYNERARIARREVSDAALVDSFRRIDAARGEVLLTYFEFGTLAAVDLFMRETVDVAILEVGLGGRLDAVNAFDSTCSVVTTVDLDHMEYLGNDRNSIGREKAGIFRPGRPAICGDEDPPAALVEHAKTIGAQLHVLGRDYGFNAEAGQWQFWSHAGKKSALPHPALRGVYQPGNAATVLEVLDQLKEALPVDMGAIRRGLLEVDLSGRFQVLPGRPLTILDVAHNPHAARGMAASLDALPPGKTFAVFAMLKDKDIEGVVAAVHSRIDEWLISGLDTPRGANVERIGLALATVGVSAPVTRFDTPESAFRQAVRSAGQNDKILVFGSFYTVGAVLRARG
ncbi:MAG TPA: bifunctional tetrahydrofolate synthase/dihydrofolate synthase [Burkholderiales bacterium]|nr:bifunctional tetrahydrofolate synthase/dihydrofolate synthase [Burkholderiales bacterium]